MKRVNTLVTAIFAAVVALSFVPEIPAATPTEVTPSQLNAARTAPDHEAIAAAYEAEATEADRKAAGHEMMAKTYRAGGTPKGNPQAMVSHCDRLVAQYRAAAKEYRALASEHRQLAKDAGQ